MLRCSVSGAEDQVPGHEFPGGTSRAAPSRTTTAIGVAMACSRAVAVCARYSCWKPVLVFGTTTPKMTTASGVAEQRGERGSGGEVRGAAAITGCVLGVAYVVYWRWVERRLVALWAAAP